MLGNIGYFTFYGIEYVFEFLGKERINQKIIELKDKPTMGLNLKEFTYGDSNYSYANEKGVLFIFNMLLDWFQNDHDFAIFLFENSKKLSKETYFDGINLKNKQNENHQENFEIVINQPEKLKINSQRLENPFWIEYHFFMQSLVKIFFKKKNELRFNSILEEIFESYLKHTSVITSRFKKDIAMWPSNGLRSEIAAKMIRYYSSKGDTARLSSIDKKIISHGWRI